MMPARMGRPTQALWGCFALSLAAITFLAVRDAKRGPRIRIVRESRPGLAATAKCTELESGGLARPGKPDSAGRAGKSDQPSPVASGPTPDSPGPESPPGSPPGAGDPSDPVAFIDRILELLKTGDLDGLLSHGEPGFVRAVMPFLEVDLFLGKKDKLSRIADSLQVDLEEAPGDRFRLRLSIEGKVYSGEDIFLVPHEESWRLAAESDLPGPLADRQRTVERLRLFGLARLAYLEAGLGGPGFRNAETARELQHGLERSSAYAGILDPGLAAAVDDGRTLGGYRFGRIGAGSEGFAYIASPAAYGPESRETFVIDSIGKVWARDLGGEPPPPLEGSADLDKSGWIRVEGSWPRF